MNKSNCSGLVSENLNRCFVYKAAQLEARGPDHWWPASKGESVVLLWIIYGYDEKGKHGWFITARSL